MKEIVAPPASFGLTRRALLLSAGATAAYGGIAPRPASAVVQIDVTQGNVQPLPIALPDFLGSAGDSEVARNIPQVIASDLKRSGLFIPIDPAAYLERITDIDAIPRFADWRTINAAGLVTGRIVHDRGGFGVDFRLWDVPAGGYLVGRRYDGTPENWRRMPISSPTRSTRK